MYTHTSQHIIVSSANISAAYLAYANQRPYRNVPFLLLSYRMMLLEAPDKPFVCFVRSCSA